MPTFTDAQIAFIETLRAGRLATASADGQPHVIPVCYARDGASFYIALDAKPKRVAPTQLRRVRNLLENPQVALVIDRYSDDWSELAYVLVRGAALLLPPGEAEHARAIDLLRARYPQYRAMPIEQQPIIAIRAESIVAWGALERPV
ncbi:MAG TPA: TIGR03668 family PPOX class F420-dependent oxidoreductase [Roseiflexaceae bacterium]|nr:TIGR03668 family PPOX class F420-dependent oxidoreductase [Roseiflexaceae bacterium]